MGDRVSRIILLCEDDAQRRLALAYMNRAGIRTGHVVDPLVASERCQGGNVDWVLREFPRQLHACRQRQHKAKTLIVVLVDADESTVEERRRQLEDGLDQPGYEKLAPGDPAALLIPRRHIETWLCSLLHMTVSEEENCKGRKKKWEKEDFRRAADTAYEWARENATPGPTCVSSLRTAFPAWRKIG